MFIASLCQCLIDDLCHCSLIINTIFLRTINFVVVEDLTTALKIELIIMIVHSYAMIVHQILEFNLQNLSMSDDLSLENFPL